MIVFCLYLPELYSQYLFLKVYVINIRTTNIAIAIKKSKSLKNFNKREFYISPLVTKVLFSALS